MIDPTAARESRLRSILKALSYRLTGTVTTVALTLAVTGEVGTALAMGSIEPAVKIAIYYVHERAWQQVPVGTVRRLVSCFALPRRWLQRLRSPVG